MRSHRRYGTRGLHAKAVHPDSHRRAIVETFRCCCGWRVWAKNAAVGAPSESVEQGAASTVWTAIAEKWEHKSKRHRTKGLLTYEGKLKKVLSKQTTVKTGGSHRFGKEITLGGD